MLLEIWRVSIDQGMFIHIDCLEARLKVEIKALVPFFSFTQKSLVQKYGKAILEKINNVCAALFLYVLKRTFRSCTNRLKSFQQGTKSSNKTNSLSRTNRYLVIFGKTAGIIEPGQRTLNNPSLGQDLPLGLNAH